MQVLELRLHAREVDSGDDHVTLAGNDPHWLCEWNEDSVSTLSGFSCQTHRMPRTHTRQYVPL